MISVSVCIGSSYWHAIKQQLESGTKLEDVEVDFRLCAQGCSLFRGRMLLQSVSSLASFLLHTIWFHSVFFGSHTHPGV